jgi:hypothetical protein
VPGLADIETRLNKSLNTHSHHVVNHEEEEGD